MTHRDAGDYSTKHGAGEKPNPAVAKAVTAAADAGKIACAQVFSIASELGVGPAEAGKTVDLLKIRLVKCQLGLFGYTPGEIDRQARGKSYARIGIRHPGPPRRQYTPLRCGMAARG